jgi:hypothetical protein
MRTTFAAEPRSFDWHSGFHTKTYIAQPLPPIGWKRVCVSDAIKWCDGILLTWASKNDSGETPTSESNVAGFLSGRLGRLDYGRTTRVSQRGNSANGGIS